MTIPRIGLNLTLLNMQEAVTGMAGCNLHYIDAIAAAGALPVLVPPLTDERLLDAALDGIDGFCFIGGPDYHPDAYGGHPQAAADLMHVRRHRFDLALAKRLMGDRRPLLGICGGHQLINIGWGGALVQDIPSEWRAAPPLPHALVTRGTTISNDRYQHLVSIAPGSRLGRILGAERIATNSFHHQAVDPQRLGSGLVATAWTEDGVIEALELPGERLVVGVQWHPERMVGDATSRALFAALIAAAATATRCG